MLTKKTGSNLTVRRSQTEAFRETYIENVRERINAQERTNNPRFKVTMPTAEEIYSSIDTEHPELAEKWTKKYIEWQVGRGGLSESYIKSLSTTIRAWDKFCLSRGAFAYPAKSEIIGLWFDSLLRQGKKLATVKNHKAMMTYLFEKIFVLSLADNPVRNEIYVGSVLKSARRSNIESDIVTNNELQAKPLREADISRLYNITTKSNAIYFRDLVFISIAYASMARISELRTLKRWQVQERPDGDVQIIRVHSKTTDSPLPKTITSDYAKLLKEYLHRFCANHDDNHYIFSHLTHFKGFKNVNKPMSLKGAIDIFKRSDLRVNSNRKQELGIRETWTAHSCRVGGAIDGYLSGMTVAELMQLGDWKSEAMLLRYLRGVSISTNVKIQTGFIDR